MAPNGKGTDYKELETMWRTIAKRHQSVNITRLREIFFDFRANHVDVVGDAHWAGSLESVLVVAGVSGKWLLLEVRVCRQNAPGGVAEGVVLPSGATALQLIVALDEQAADDGGMFQV